MSPQKVSVVLDLLDWGQLVASREGMPDVWHDHRILDEIKKQVIAGSFAFNPHVQNGATGRSLQDCPPGTVPVAKRFLSDISALSCIYGVTLSHQDGHGAFIVEDFDQKNLDWLEAASIEVKTPSPKLDQMMHSISNVLEKYFRQRRDEMKSNLISDAPVKEHVRDTLTYVVEKCRHYLALYPMGVQRTEIVKEIMAKSLVALSSLDASSGGPAVPGHGESVGRDEHKFVLTAYLDGGGDLQFHAGPCVDFDREVASIENLRILKTFTIAGRITDEGGETEPIKVNR